MELEFVQTFIPTVHTGIDEGMIAKPLSWIEKNWKPLAVIVVAIVAIGIWCFCKEKKQPIKEVPPTKEKATPIADVDPFNKPYTLPST